MRRIAVGPGDFDPGAELAALGSLGGGAVASFIGHVRDDGGLAALELEHYPSMTVAALGAIVDDATARWPLLGVTVLHRVGRLAIGERIVLVAVAAGHRGDALDACAFLIDWLKVKAPFWKREHRSDGSSTWVEARASDDAQAGRWV